MRCRSWTTLAATTALVASLGSPAAVAAPSADEISFAVPLRSEVDAGVEISVAGDLDGDGTIDLIGANELDTTFSVLTSKPDGAWKVAARGETGVQVTDELKVGDLNGDGDLDLVALTRYRDQVSVVLGRPGSLRFGKPTVYRVRNAPQGVEIVDLDGDGDHDLAIAKDDRRRVVLLENDGSGGFARRTFLPYDAREVESGDIDGDGALDLVLGSTGQDELRVLLSTGPWTFDDPIVLPSAEHVNQVLPVDLDGDGDLDLAVGNGYGSYEFSVHLGEGDGTFEPPVSQLLGLTGRLDAVDLDRDGALDLVVDQAFDDIGDDLDVLRGRGDGTFRAHQEVAAGMFHDDVHISDVDGDGWLDLVGVTGGGTTGSVATVRNTSGDS